MDMAAILSYIGLYFIIWICFYVLITSNLRARKSPKYPPGPNKLPFIGNLHQIGQNPHQSFAKLSKKYGPLMSVKLGSKDVVIVSNASVAREILQKNDQICAYRSVPTAVQAHDHDKFSTAWIPVSTPTWRLLRKVLREQMLAVHRLDGSQELRQEKLLELLQFIEKSSSSGEVIDIGSAAFITALNLMSKTLFSTDFGSHDSGSSQELKELVWGLMKYTGVPNLSDYFPVLRRFDPQGIMRASRLYFGKLLDIFDGIIKERLLERGESRKSDLLEALLDENLKNGAEFNINVLKHLLVDLFVAGIDTTSNTVEWAMAELLRSPGKIEKARAELKQVIGEKTAMIQESDIPRLPYLQAIVKETFRLHPVVPLLLPRQPIKDVEINGYIVPKGTEILTNVWASGRDDATWEQPQMFMPERFLESEIEAKGNHFELIPFGGGRRMCPGLPLANRMLHLMLASLIHNVEWKLEGVSNPELLDMEDKFGLSIKKACPLKAIPLKL